MPVGLQFRALVVDDDSDIRRLLVRALKREGFDCAEAEDGVVAENTLRARRFDLVTADLAMPRLHGHKLVTDLLATPNPPVVFVVTGIIERRLARDLLRRGVADICYKPVDFELLAMRAKAFVSRAASQSPAPHGAAVPEQIANTATLLQAQLEQIQASFRATIADLEHQKSKLEAGLVGSVRVLTRLMNQVAQFEGSHAVRVERMSVAISEDLGVPPSEQNDIKVAALLHDIGQFGMPDSVRTKPPWELGPEERKIYETYPTIGALLLSEITGIEYIVRLVETHTERFDGSGFPLGLRGEAIPLGARILAAADAFDTAAQFMDCVAAVNHLAQNTGRLYDPRVVASAINYARASESASRKERKVVPVRVSDLALGAVVAEPIYNERGIMLVNADRELTQHALEKVKLLAPGQLVNVYVDSEDSGQA